VGNRFRKTRPSVGHARHLSIENGAITNKKLANCAVTATKIKPGSLTEDLVRARHAADLLSRHER
jgi:hypothetical protein